MFSTFIPAVCDSAKDMPYKRPLQTTTQVDLLYATLIYPEEQSTSTVRMRTCVAPMGFAATRQLALSTWYIWLLCAQTISGGARE